MFRFDPFMILAQEGGGLGDVLFLVIWLALVILAIAGLWRVFEKAGQPGWGVLIPIYNLVLLARVAGRPGWWALLLFIPLVNIVVGIVMALDIAKNFGKGPLFTLGLIFLGFIFYPILGFGDAQYRPVKPGV